MSGSARSGHSCQDIDLTKILLKKKTYSGNRLDKMVLYCIVSFVISRILT